MSVDTLEGYPVKLVPSGETLLFTGEVPGNLFFLKKGYVKHFVDSEEGRELIIHIYEPGAIFPLMWGLNGSIPNYSLGTLTDCEISLIPRDEYLVYIKNHPEKLFELTKRLLGGISGLSKRIEIISLENARVRTASAMSYLHKHFGEKLNFTHEDLSALTGLSRERISIEMKKLKDDGFLTYERGVINITDGGGLMFENYSDDERGDKLAQYPQDAQECFTSSKNSLAFQPSVALRMQANPKKS